MSGLAIHTIFDILAWLVSLTTLWILRRTWFADATPATRNLGYLAAVLAGAGLGAWFFGSLNLIISHLGLMGRSIEGAVAGAIIAVEVYKWLAGISARTGAIYALPLALGIAIGRIGCQFAGMEDLTYGTPTALPWGFDHGDGINRHPVASYESIAMLVFALTYGVAMMRGLAWVKRNGFYLAIAVYAVERFGLEFLKPYGTLVAGLTLFQIVSVALLIYALVMMRGETWHKEPETR